MQVGWGNSCLREEWPILHPSWPSAPAAHLDAPSPTPRVQYGEVGGGQDRGDHFGFAGRGGGGGSKGGEAGSRNKPGQDVSFIRHVPKFLQVGGGRGFKKSNEV